jgi:hypothetical protein
MNYIAGRIYTLEAMEMTGEVEINGKPKKDLDMIPFTSYVM